MAGRPRSIAVAAGLLLALATSAWTPPAAAQGDAALDDGELGVAPSPDEEEPENRWDEEPGRIAMMFTGHVGMLALPFADVCPFVASQCEPGETGLAAGLAIFGRWSDFSIGGSFTYALGLKPSEAAGNDVTLGREHSRTYLLLEGHFRYFFLATGDWEWFAQASLGGIIINDSWTTIADREPYGGFALVGPVATTVSTEGVTVGGGIGGLWRINSFWSLGTRLRYNNWFLPTTREETPVGDSASLAGRVDMLEVGAFGGFRLPL